VIVSRRWLEDMLGHALDPGDLEQRLHALGTPVEGVVALHADLGDVRVARVLEVKKHPNADRLSLCLVDAGGPTPVEVVCGAPNVAAGKLYPYVAAGAVLPGGVTLTRRLIRGVESNGMLCSAKELGLGGDHEGILELDTEAAPGTRFLDVVPIADHQITLEVTANRPDLLCHKGVARELAASLGATLKLPPIPGAPTAGGTRGPARAPGREAAGVVDGVAVRIEDEEGCPRYMAAVVRGVRVGPSPTWLVRRLASIGQRSINNIVDATNYILFEVNQPLHAFDLARLRGPAVVIRRAHPGERIVTLDGVSRTLTADMTAICDAERPTIVAGVMGSAESEVAADTTDVVLECAYFQPTRIRRTRRALGLSSESSYRFERGIDLLGMPDALRRALDLLVAVGGGELREPPLDLWPHPVAERTIFLRPERASALLGMPIERAEIEQLLPAIGFVVAPKDRRLAVQVPGWRPDVTAEVDLIEEVARLKGYDVFPHELRPYRPGTVPDAPLERAKGVVRAGLAAAGLHEARTLPLGPPDGSEAVAVLNPMSTAEAHLRTRLLPGLLRRVEHNWAGHNRDIRLFEVGTVFRRGPQGIEEWTSVAAVLTGAQRPPHWTEGAKVPDMDIWELRHHFDLAVSLAAPGATVLGAAEGGAWEAVGAGGGEGGEGVVGWAGVLEADRPVWAAPVLGFELRLHLVDQEPRRYRALPVTPPVERDVALVLPPAVNAAAVAAVLRREGGPLLETLRVFDEYRGPGIAAGSRSVAWHLLFRDPGRTLRETEADTVLAGALKVLEAELGVRRRES